MDKHKEQDEKVRKYTREANKKSKRPKTGWKII